MKKEAYERPLVDVELFDAADVITESGGAPFVPRRISFMRNGLICFVGSTIIITYQLQSLFSGVFDVCRLSLNRTKGLTPL